MMILRLAVAALLPVAAAVLLTVLVEKNRRFAALPYAVRQAIIGVLFAAIACLATQYGVPAEGAQLNVRDAAPLTAGLLFGGPAGIIAGVIGGAYRWFSVYWGIGAYTRVACSVATVIAGVIGALCRKFMFENKKASWVYGLFIGVVTEVFHMLMVCITHMDDLKQAFTVMASCANYMIPAVGLSVMLSLWICSLIGTGQRPFQRNKTRRIAQTFSLALLAAVMVSFIITSVFTYMLQDNICSADTEKQLTMTIDDVDKDINDAIDQYLLSVTRGVTTSVCTMALESKAGEQNTAEETADLRNKLQQIADRFDVSEINIVSQQGLILLSTNELFDGFDMCGNPGGQAIEFMCLTEGESEYVQDYRPQDYDQDVYYKYAGIALPSGGFVQAGYDAGHFRNAIKRQVSLAAKNRHIGDSGFVSIYEMDTLALVSSTDDETAVKLVQAAKANSQLYVFDECLIITIDNNVQYLCMARLSESYLIVGCIPMSQAMFTRDTAIYLTDFMMMIVFAVLFVLIYFLIRRIVVNNIQSINRSLARITQGDLSIVVNVRSNEEFASLSDDINTTVTTLKQYISAAEARIDRELEFARSIQRSALPSIFPPHPNLPYFDVFASMDAAKQVGGDFYDFYFVDMETFVVLVADVAGKGIPAAMFMMTAKTMIKNLAESGLSIEEVMSQANQKLCEMNEADMFVTVWMGAINLRTGLMKYVSAGHNPPLVKLGSGKFEYLTARSGLVLAGMEGIRYRLNELQLHPGDWLYLYTDGVTEANNREEKLYGDRRLQDYLNGCDALDVTETCKGVRADIDAFADGADQFDDITMLMFRLKKTIE